MSSWFRPKRYGYGASPANWNGWLAILVFVAFALVITSNWGPLGGEGPPLRFAALAAATALFVWIVLKKSEGTWRWRWGPDNEEK
jgi:4-amino-4-deoxy-L-arabinose transferase-like glycosyltransferase